MPNINVNNYKHINLENEEKKKDFSLVKITQ